jgi:membrane fusion protein (multidrug efflux system)
MSTIASKAKTRAESPDSVLRAEAPRNEPAPSRPEPDARTPSAAPTGEAQASAAPGKAKGGRNVARLSLMALGVIGVAVIGTGYWLRGGRWISTDDAYIRAPKLMVSTDISGIVDSVDVREGQRVKAGDILFRVDRRQFEIALAAAKADLESTRISLTAAKADYAQLQSGIAAQDAQVALAQINFDRSADLLKTNSGTKAAFDQARFALEAARQQLQALKRQSDAALVRLGGSADTPVEQLPQFLAAQARLDEATRQLDHTVVRAPFAGTVTQVDKLQPGTYLVSQTAALTNTGAVALVASDGFFIEANVKETDLTFIKTGDPVDVAIDAYPGRVWKGVVDSIAPASGSEFSIIPAQNASGNWVKVVQRVPLRVKLLPDADAPALRAGMSVVADIDTGHVRHLSELWTPAAPPQGKVHGDDKP